jgi:starch synthase
MALPALRRLLSEEDVQFVALGTGDPDLNHILWLLGQDFRSRAVCFLGYNATVAQRIYGGADIFLMPSRFEPCGIGQMVAMRYGALPLVRETGGLADTVQNYDNDTGEAGTGFSFLWETPDAVYGTLKWALDTYRNRQDAWVRMQHRAMTTDLSWSKSAAAYIDLYQRIKDKRKGST